MIGVLKQRKTSQETKKTIQHVMFTMAMGHLKYKQIPRYCANTSRLSFPHENIESLKLYVLHVGFKNISIKAYKTLIFT